MYNSISDYVQFDFAIIIKIYTFPKVLKLSEL